MPKPVNVVFKEPQQVYVKRNTPVRIYMSFWDGVTFGVAISFGFLLFPFILGIIVVFMLLFLGVLGAIVGG